MNPTPFGKSMLQHFNFAPSFRNLNNGAFGAPPTTILQTRRSFEDEAESRPDPFIRYRHSQLLHESRTAIADLVHAPVETIVFVPNATVGINTVLRNLVFAPGDKILTFSTAYGAVTKTVLSVCETTPAQSVIVPLDYPLSDEEVLARFESTIRAAYADNHKVKVAIFDTITSMPGVRQPFEDLVRICKRHDVLSCIDGAHAVGHIPLNLAELDPDFFVSNLHKWLFVPRACSVFYVPHRNQPLIRTTIPTSHGFAPVGGAGPANPLDSGDDWASMFDFVGTADLSPSFCVPAALTFRAAIGGEDAIMSYNAELAARGAALVAKRLGTQVLYSVGCAMANVRLPLNPADVRLGQGDEARLCRWMMRYIAEEHNGFVAIGWHAGAWWTRLSAQVWLEAADWAWAATTLSAVCRRVRRQNGYPAHGRNTARL